MKAQISSVVVVVVGPLSSPLPQDTELKTLVKANHHHHQQQQSDNTGEIEAQHRNKRI